ncbi:MULTISPECIES: MIP/aquaporin family protein [unclassified Streptomyces]|uniref:MIP/aquaporin family protein n=1 Tax=unclassified Streptomyces TaxID=2593676 RepID=UPI00224F4B9E|nr:MULTISPECIES: MIP/aquaporin family protein [unclassified Streptomyces]MCX4791278.1 aquaporin family protein [Streptomyces sp. NBC_01221]WSP59498.1 aquaporin family protein [Streptomyces sp. NBC_01241]WSP60905.1 aquaporin family protein [Streptomyces sp. NBC_01240]
MERLKASGFVGELSAEFLGTMILILFGCGVVAQVVAGGALTEPPGGLGNHDSIAWAWGLGVTLGIYVAGRLSGAHLNPAVTLSLAAFKDFPWKKVAPYTVAQFAGAFIGALLVRWNYTEALAKADPGHTIKTQFVFSTLPANGNPALPVHEWGALRDQVIGTAILMLLIFAVTDLLNTPPGAHLSPFIVGLIIVAIGMAFGTNAGYAINPARDLGPRLASFLTGYGGAWRDQYGNLYFWVPIVGPLVGGPVGAFLYQALIGRFLPAAEAEPEGTLPLPSEN